MTTCKHCERTIIQENGGWIDPEATGDDRVWRETCDSHDTFTAEHEPVSRKDYMAGTVTHRTYYAEMVNDQVRAVVTQTFGVDRLRRSTDEHLNDIGLHRWDALYGTIRRCSSPLPDGESWSLSVAVCIAKEAARQVIEQSGTVLSGSTE